MLLLGLAVLTPPRRLWLLPAGLAVVLGALSGFATQSSIEYSRLADKQLVTWQLLVLSTVCGIVGGLIVWYLQFPLRWWLAPSGGS